MNKVEKGIEVADLHDKFSKAKVAIIAEYSGLPVADLSELRNKLRQVKGEFKVVKNTLARRAVDGTPLSTAGEQFRGPVGIGLGYDDPIEPTRVLHRFAAQQEKLKIRWAMLDGKTLSREEVKRVADLPSKDVLLAQLVNRLKSPINGLVWDLKGILNKLVYALSAVKDQKSAQAQG